VLSGGFSSSATIRAGELISSGGSDSGTVVNGAEQEVLSGGTALNSLIENNGVSYIFAGGLIRGATLSGTDLLGNRTQQLLYGSAVSTLVGSGGWQRINAGGVASGTIVASGGEQDVSNIANSTVIASGGLQHVYAGAVANNTLISGGTMLLDYGATASGSIAFAGGGTLQINGLTMPSAFISGFGPGSIIDLASEGFSSGGSVTLEAVNVLQVVEYGQSLILHFDPKQNFAGALFTLAPDGNTGTDIILTTPTSVGSGPALSNIATSGSYVEEGGAVTLATSGTVTDQNSTTLIGATVAITSGTFANDADVLAATTSGTSITASYNSGTETLTLSGTDTLAHYQQVLRSVSFVAGENPTNYGADPTRTVTWTVNDGGASFNLSPPQTETIGITNVNDPPVLSNVASTVAFHSGTTTTLSPNTTVSDPDDLSLVGGTVIVTSGGFANDGDVLSATTSGTSITATYNSGTETLTLSGTDTLAHYQSVLDSVTLASGNNPTNTGANRTRTVTWQVNDGEAANNLSTPVQTTVNITTIDSSRPVVTPTSLAVNQSHLHTVAASTLFTAGDADGDFIVQYDFWDTGVGGAHWIINGTPSTPNTDNYASNLSQVSYQSGAGTDTLYVRASDGTGFGSWSQAFMVTDTAPVVTPTNANVNVSHQNPVSATSLFTASDADTDSIVQYDFWDSGQAGGHWLLRSRTVAVPAPRPFMSGPATAPSSAPGYRSTPPTRRRW
jgi:autotransporter passenger strand-loop-strand repeat protein